MADAFGTYFVTHARGLALNAKRVLQAELTSFEVGDCQFADPGHHGTPLQRLRSVTWAANLAAAARPQGVILPSLRFADLFEQKLPEIVAPGRPVGAGRRAPVFRRPSSRSHGRIWAFGTAHGRGVVILAPLEGVSMQRLSALLFCALVSLVAFPPAAHASEVVAQTSYDISDASGREGDGQLTSMTFTITRSGNLDVATTIHPWTQDITATHKVDYVNILSTNSLTFDAGETTKTVVVQIKPDFHTELDETLRLRLANPGVGETDIGIGTIVDSHPPAGPNAFSIDDASVAEGYSGSTATAQTITRTGDVSGWSTVIYRTVQDTATQGVDYTGTTGTTVTFGPGQDKALVSFAVTGDRALEPDETFKVELYNPTGSGTSIDDGTGVVTIVNDDAAPSYYDISDATGLEGETEQTTMTFTITRSGNLDVATTIHPWTQDITTNHKVDFVNIQSTNSLTFDVGETTKTVTVQIKPDLIDEPDETFRLRLANPYIGETDIGIGTIVDITPDAGPNTISVSNASQVEDNSVWSPAGLTLTRTGDLTGSATVSYRTVQGTATQGVDYVGVSAATVTFAPGQNTISISIWVKGETTVEPDETFSVELFDATGHGTSVDDGTGVVTIVDDDAPSFYDISDATGVESESGTTSMTFTVTRTGNTGHSTTVHPWTQDITASHAIDYVNRPSTTPLTFTAGETTKTVTVQIKPDLIDEPDETFRLRLLAAERSVGHRDIGIGTIVDDDPAP